MEENWEFRDNDKIFDVLCNFFSSATGRVSSPRTKNPYLCQHFTALHKYRKTTSWVFYKYFVVFTFALKRRELMLCRSFSDACEVREGGGMVVHRSSLYIFFI